MASFDCERVGSRVSLFCCLFVGNTPDGVDVVGDNRNYGVKIKLVEFYMGNDDCYRYENG